MKKERRIRAVLLDLDGTLYRSRSYDKAFLQATYSVMSERLGKPLSRTIKLVEEKRRRLISLTRSIEALGLSRQDFYRLMAGRLKVENHISKDEKLNHILNAMRALGLRVALFTNTGKVLAAKILDALGLSPAAFDLFITGDEAGLKPSMNAYLYSVKKMGVEYGETIYVGDRIGAEIRPAKRIGMVTIHISTRKKKSRWADFQVSSIHELPILISRLVKKG